ncbi:hypothetical protein GCM10029976_047460 [Kribbella albertanoniae]|uniref:F5/8 type C domain-containing protein n=1 Tax=Kribbella albertanoniae TaxID=1266829 RepID=A0A4R4QG14_9ACTN|nr:RICIN domain-containing protein [Kribbella albertanoniae]TDC34153.1 hypothetical protein E1261_04320 [Kribbella albertanoniae]
MPKTLLLMALLVAGLLPAARDPEVVDDRRQERVELTHLRTETTQVFAEPGGGRTLEQYAVPVRARTDDGWVPIDTTLRFGADGSVRPVAVVSELVLSGGGTGDRLAELADGADRITLGWMGRLPRPTLAGPIATYPEVLPGVDLRIEAQAAGFAQVLVVKNRKAALNPALRQLRFPLRSTGLSLTTTASGTTQAKDANGRLVFSAGTPTMWTGRDLAMLRTTRSARELIVVPDLALLTGPKTQYPVYIDPSFSAGQYRWTKVNRRLDDKSYWTTYRERALTGYAEGGAGKGDMFRSFFQLDTSPLAGSTVHNAQFQIVLDRTTTKTATPVDLWRTKSIDPSDELTWDNSGSHWLEKLAQAKGTAHDDKPDMGMGFTSSSLLRMIQKAATDEALHVTVGLRAPDEDEGDQWKEFYPDTAKIVVEYNNAPFPPQQLGFQQPRPCGTATSPAAIDTTQPVFGAVAGDPDSENVTTKLSVYRADNGALEYEADSALTTPGSTFSWPPVPDGELIPGVVYYYRARSSDPLAAGPSTADCYFVIDQVGPDQPTAQSADYPDGQGVVKARTMGTITLRAAAGDTDVAEFVYGFSRDRMPYRVPARPDGTAEAPVTMASDLPVQFYASAVDRAGNTGPASAGRTLRALPNPDPVPRVRGDVNGDGRADSTAVLDHGDGRTAIWNSLGTTGTIGWDSGNNGGFALQRTQTAQGDFDGDGRADLALLRGEAGHRVALFKLRSEGNGYNSSATPLWSSDSTGWQHSTARLTAGDVNGDGRDDLAVQVDNGNGTWRMLVFAGPQLSAPIEWLPSAPGVWRRSTAHLGDIDADGNDDLISVRDAGSCRTVVTVHRSTGTAFAAAGETLLDQTGLCQDRIRPAIGDVDGDGKDDVVLRYEHGPADLELRVLRTGGTALESWWRAPGQFNAAQTTLSTGDVTGDGKDDVTLVATTAGGGRDFYTLAATGTAFGARQLSWSVPTAGAISAAKFDIEQRSYELVARHSRQCLAVRGASQSLGAAIEQQSCSGALHQRFQIDTIIGSPYVMLHPAHADGERDDGRSTCLDAGRPPQSEGAPLVQQQCLGVLHQQLTLEYVEGTSYDSVVRVKHGGRCATVRDGSTASGSPVLQQNCGTAAHQEWILRPAVNTPQLDGRFKVTALRGGKAIENTNCVTGDAADVRMNTWDAENGCQQWQLRPLGDDMYRIIDIGGSRAIEPQSCATSNATLVHLSSITAGDCQRWRIEPAYDGTWSILHAINGKALDVGGCRKEALSDLILWTYWNGPCQRWLLERQTAAPALPVAAVTASAHDGNVPTNTIDNNPATRWSAQGDGVWIQYDLGHVRNVDDAVLSWHGGDNRSFDFRLQLSLDGVTWTDSTSFTSSGDSTGPELYDLPSTVPTRYLRLTGYGNTTNTWTSLTEAAFFAP